MVEGLNAGDKVVALAAAARTAAIAAGAVSGAIAMWIARHRLALSCLGFLAGAFLGWILGGLAAKLVFPGTAGHVVIAKTGPSALPMTITGNLTATLVTGLAVAVLVVLITKTEFRAVVPLSLGAAVVIGVTFALLASLL